MMQKFKSFLPKSIQPGYPDLCWTKITALLLAITLVFPHLAWSFEYINLFTAKGMIINNNRPVEIPGKIGKINRTFHGQDRLVIHIEDLHCNYEIQSNIAKIIDHLARWHSLRLVTMEGADKPVNVAKLSSFPIEAVKKEVGEYFIKQGKISGAEFYAAAGRYPIDLEGIENPEHYRQGRELVSGFLNNESQGYLLDLRDMLEELKKSIYSPELFKFDAKKTAWREGRLSSLKYCIFLKQRAVRSGLKGFPLIKRYVSQGEEVLWPGLDPEQFYQEIERLDGILREGLYTGTKQRELDQHQHRLDIMEKLLNISVTPAELAEYQAQAPAFQIKNFQDFIQGYAAGEKYPWDPGIYGLDRWLGKVRAFYANADQRSLDFIKNLLTRMEHHQAKIAVLITGGYHTPVVLQELQQRNISFISIQPGLTRQDLVNPYFSLLREQRTPLEMLLSKDQKVMALEPFFAQWDKIRIKADQLPAEVRLGYDLLEITLKLDYIHYLQEKGVAGLEGLQAEYRQAIAEYEENSQRIKLDLNRVLAGERFFAVPFEGASYFAVLGPPGQSPVSGAFQTMAIKDDLELTFHHKAEWDVMAGKIEGRPIQYASHALVRRRLLQAVCPGGESVIFAGTWIAPHVLNWMKRLSLPGESLPTGETKTENRMAKETGGERNTAQLKEIIQALIESPDHELHPLLEEKVDAILHAQKNGIIPGPYRFEAAKDVFNNKGENIWEYRWDTILFNVQNLSRLMQEQIPSSPAMEYITENFKAGMAKLLKHPEIQKMTFTEIDEIYLWLSEMVSDKLYQERKRVQNNRGKEHYKKLACLIDGLREEDEGKDLQYAFKCANLGNMLEDKYFKSDLFNAEAFKAIDDRCLIQKDFFDNLMNDLARLQAQKGTVKYYIDNAGEFYLDLLAIKLLLESGLEVVVMAKDQAGNNDDLSAANVREILEECLQEDDFKWLKKFYANNSQSGRLKVMSHNTRSYGVNLNYQDEPHKQVRTNPNSITIYKGGANDYAVRQQKEETNSYHLFGLKEQDQIATAHALGFEPEKIISGNLVFYAVPKEQRGYDLEDILKNGDYFRRKSESEYNIQETAAYRLLEALELLAIEDNPAIVIEETVKYPEYTVRRIRIPERSDNTKPPRGLEILQNEIADIVRFDLLYNKKNQLIAIFPALPLETNSKSTHIAYNGIRYFNLGEYYFKDSEITVPEIEGKWKKMYTESELNIRVIKSYLEIVLGKRASSALMIDYESGKQPYAYISVDRETGKWQSYEVGMKYKKHPDVKPHPNREEIIIPVYPTVYSPGNPVADVDDGYYNYIYKHMGLRLNHKVLVVGPGSGSDTWTISRKTGGKVWAVGINPLEVANTVQTAAIGGFEVDAVVGNNIIDEMGHSVFPGRKFNRIVWDMPHFSHRSLGFSGRHPSFSRFWDPDYKGEVLKRFVKGLPVLLEPDGYAIIWNKNIPDTMLHSFEGVKIEKVASMVYKIILTEPVPASSNKSQIDPKMFNRPFYTRHLEILQRWRLPRALWIFILANGWLLVQTTCQAFPRLKISGTDKDLDTDSNKELNLMKLRHGMPGVRFRPLSGKSWGKIWGMITGLYRENEQTPATIYTYSSWLKLIQEPELKGDGSLESGLAGWRYALTRRLLDNLLAYHRVDYLYSGTGFWERNLDKLFRLNIQDMARDTLAMRGVPGFGTRMARWAVVKLPWPWGLRNAMRISIQRAYPDWEIKKILEGIKAAYPQGKAPDILDALDVQFNRPESGVYQAYLDMVRASPKKFTQQQTEFFRQLRHFILPNQTSVPEQMPDNIAVYLELISRLDFGPSLEIGRWSVHNHVPGYLSGRAISLPLSMKNSPGARELRVIISMLRRCQPWIILNNRTMEEMLYPRRTPHIFEQAA